MTSSQTMGCDDEETNGVWLKEYMEDPWRRSCQDSFMASKEWRNGFL